MDDINLIKYKPKDSFTQAALSMLTCCLQKVSIEMIDASGNKATPSYFDKMAGIAMGLGETIYRMENNKYDNDTESNNLDDVDIVLIPEE